MFSNRVNVLGYLVLVIFIMIKLLGAQEVPNTSSSNQGNSPSSAQPRFSDLGAMGFPNFGSGRFRNPTSNYPANSFFPFGNQNNNMQRPQEGSGLGFQNRPNQGQPNQENYPNQQGYPNQQSYPNQQGYPNFQGYPNQQGYANPQGYPYQGDSMDPYPNYQRPQDMQNRPLQGRFPNQNNFPYQGDSSNRYPNYQQPLYPNRPDEGSMMYPDEINGGISNQGGFNRPISGHPVPGSSFQYPQQSNQYPSQGNFQSVGNPNLRPDQMNNFRPDDLGNFANSNIHFPDRPYQYQPNQNYLSSQNLSPVYKQPGNFQNYPSNNIINSSVQSPPNHQDGVGLSGIQYPNEGLTNNGGPGGDFPGQSVNQGNIYNVQNQPQSPTNQDTNLNFNDTAAIMGKPVIVASTTTSPNQPVFVNSTAAETQKQCVQDCPTTSEYDPVCGTNNVTYINPGKFICAQKCGVVVYLHQRGRCDGDIIPNRVTQ